MRALLTFVICSIFAFAVAPIPSTAAPNAAPSLSWGTCGTCPEAPIISFSGNTISMGTFNTPEYQNMNNAVHGVSALLPPAAEYTITFDYSLSTWDSYNPKEYSWSGYWDSFSVSVSAAPYWQLNLSDPITKSTLPGLGFIWGGTVFADGIKETTTGQNKVVVVPGNPSGDNYLNVVLDTTSQPDSNHMYPSWGTITIKDVVVSGGVVSNDVIEIAKSLVGAPYTYGAKSWDYAAVQKWADLTQIFTTKYKYFKKDFGFVDGVGIDCSGLVLRSYNMAASANKLLGGPITYEGADGQYRNCTTPISESELRPGDLLFFDKVAPFGEMDHVAMYVGNINNGYDVIHATPPYAKWDKKDELNDLTYFKGYGRVRSCGPAMVIQTKSPITLQVTDPDGYTITSTNVRNTGEELLSEIPGILYYALDENLDDYVYSPVLKPGIYTVKAIRKPGVASSETFTIIMEGGAKQVVLAQDLPVSEITLGGFLVASTGDEIIPIGMVPDVKTFLPVIRLKK